MKRVGRRNNYWSKVTIELACTVETDGNSNKTVTLKETFRKMKGITVFQSEYFFRITNRSFFIGFSRPKINLSRPPRGAPHSLRTLELDGHNYTRLTQLHCLNRTETSDTNSGISNTF
jgi:hypothetical protein